MAVGLAIPLGQSPATAPFRVADGQLDVLAAGAATACRLPGRQGRLDQGADGTDRRRFDQRTER
eukprot:8008148-Alexandrium_andersonii.AAC.1